MRFAERDARTIHTQAPQVVEHEAAEEIGADLAKHLHLSPQAVQTGSRIARTAARTQEESLRQPELTWSRNGRNRFGKDISDQDTQADDVHEVLPLGKSPATDFPILAVRQSAVARQPRRLRRFPLC